MVMIGRTNSISDDSGTRMLCWSGDRIWDWSHPYGNNKDTYVGMYALIHHNFWSWYILYCNNMNARPPHLRSWISPHYLLSSPSPIITISNHYNLRSSPSQIITISNHHHRQPSPSLIVVTSNHRNDTIPQTALHIRPSSSSPINPTHHMVKQNISTIEVR